MKPEMAAIGEILREAFDQSTLDLPPARWAAAIDLLDQGQADQDRRFAEDLVALSRSLRGFAMSLTRDAVGADDLVQDTMLRAWAARGRFVPGTSMRSWTFTILKHAHITNCRRLRFVGTYDEDLERGLASGETQSAAVYLADVHRAFAQLNDDQRDALQMVAIDQLSYEEAADRSGVPINTLKSRVARARHALVAWIEGGEPESRASSPVPALRPIDRWRAAKAAGGQYFVG